MDLLSSMLKTLRLDASIFLHSSFCQEWVIDINAMDVATFHLVAHGDCWLHMPDMPKMRPLPLHRNDLLVLPHNAPHYVTSSPEPPRDDVPRNTPADVISGPSTTLICGTAKFSQSYWNPLVEALPEYVIMPHAEYAETTLGKAVAALIDECERNEAGSEVVIDRLADILFIEVLRAYVERSRGDSFLLALSDPKISRALAMFHDEPGRAWTVQDLAAEANMSRSAFADRFQSLVGSSPMQYLTRWRMQHAHHLLTDTDSQVGDIAEQCGYHNEESFTKAFRKEFGVGPASVRRRENINDVVRSISVQADPQLRRRMLYGPLEANELRLNKKAVFIDVRAADAYQRGHIPGAVNIPELFSTLSFTTPDGLSAMQRKLVPLLRRAGVTRDKTAIVYEDDLASQCGGSCRGYFQLTLFGHPDAAILDGGFQQWLREGFPVVTTQTETMASAFDAAPQRQYLATVDDVILALDHPDIKLLDNRDKQEWLGITSAPLEYYPEDFLPRKGRIPGARWIEWRHFMTESDGASHFRSPDEIRALCAQAGLYPDDDVIIYCFKGARAANTWVAMRLAGFKHVRNYYGSWNEWSRNAALPAMSVRLVG